MAALQADALRVYVQKTGAPAQHALWLNWKAFISGTDPSTSLFLTDEYYDPGPLCKEVSVGRFIRRVFGGTTKQASRATYAWKSWLRLGQARRIAMAGGVKEFAIGTTVEEMIDGIDDAQKEAWAAEVTAAKDATHQAPTSSSSSDDSRTSSESDITSAETAPAGPSSTPADADADTASAGPSSTPSDIKHGVASGKAKAGSCKTQRSSKVAKEDFSELELEEMKAPMPVYVENKSTGQKAHALLMNFWEYAVQTSAGARFGSEMLLTDDSYSPNEPEQRVSGKNLEDLGGCHRQKKWTASAKLARNMGPVQKGSPVEKLLKLVVGCLKMGGTDDAWKQAQQEALTRPRVVRTHGPSVLAPTEGLDLSSIPDDVLLSGSACPFVRPAEEWAEWLKPMGLGGAVASDDESSEGSSSGDSSEEAIEESSEESSELDKGEEGAEQGGDKGGSTGESPRKAVGTMTSSVKALLKALKAASPGTVQVPVIAPDADPNHPSLAELPGLRDLVAFLRGQLDGLCKYLTSYHCNVDLIKHQLGAYVVIRGENIKTSRQTDVYFYLGMRKLRARTEVVRALAELRPPQPEVEAIGHAEDAGEAAAADQAGEVAAVDNEGGTVVDGNGHSNSQSELGTAQGGTQEQQRAEAVAGHDTAAGALQRQLSGAGQGETVAAVAVAAQPPQFLKETQNIGGRVAPDKQQDATQGKAIGAKRKQPQQQDDDARKRTSLPSGSKPITPDQGKEQDAAQQAGGRPAGKPFVTETACLPDLDVGRDGLSPAVYAAAMDSIVKVLHRLGYGHKEAELRKQWPVAASSSTGWQFVWNYLSLQSALECRDEVYAVEIMTEQFKPRGTDKEPLLSQGTPQDVEQSADNTVNLSPMPQAAAKAATGDAADGGIALDTSTTHGPQLAAQGESLPTEAGRVLRLALPVMASEMLTFCGYLITTAQVGRLGAVELSEFSLARTLFHITGLSLVVGLTSGCDTLSGQAYGARHFRYVGVNLQKALAINLLVVGCILVGWGLGADRLMLLLGQRPAVVHGAAPLLMYMGPALLLWCVQVPIHSYLSVQGVMLPMTVVAVAGTFATFLINHLFITVLGFGLTGAVYAYNVLAALETMGFVGCMMWLHSRQPAGCKTWQGVDLKAAFSGWAAYLRIALPSLGMICLDWWSFEVMILVAGLQPDAEKQQGAMGVLFATHALAFMVCSGYGQAAATRVSNELGAGHGAAAKRATITSAVLSLCSALGVVALLMVFRRPWAHIYSQDEEVIEAVVASMPFLCMSVASDSVNNVLSAMLRGCGHQLIGFFVNLATLWGVGIGSAMYLDLKLGYGTVGVWMALAGASLLQALVLLVTISFFRWSQLADRAKQLVASGHGITAEEVAVAAGGPGGHHGVYEPLLGAAHA